MAAARHGLGAFSFFYFSFRPFTLCLSLSFYVFLSLCASGANTFLANVIISLFSFLPLFLLLSLPLAPLPSPSTLSCLSVHEIGRSLTPAPLPTPPRLHFYLILFLSFSRCGLLRNEHPLSFLLREFKVKRTPESSLVSTLIRNEAQHRSFFLQSQPRI